MFYSTVHGSYCSAYSSYNTVYLLLEFLQPTVRILNTSFVDIYLLKKTLSVVPFFWWAERHIIIKEIFFFLFLYSSRNITAVSIDSCFENLELSASPELARIYMHLPFSIFFLIENIPAVLK